MPSDLANSFSRRRFCAICSASAPGEAGDIILKIGDITIDDIYAYMTALGAFKKGDTTSLSYSRDGEVIESEITF